ncbi:unnamed protein product [Ilex paraguariensis]|uniref:Uncharacterized protein n=1 Tax=Ilex paraguariensis TaxID=185542 RepID=A0ABC8UD02_9AQUA
MAKKLPGSHHYYGVCIVSLAGDWENLGSHSAETSLSEASKPRPFKPLGSPCIFQSITRFDADHEWRTTKELNMSSEVVLYCSVDGTLEAAGISIKVQNVLVDFMAVISREIELQVSCLRRDGTTV